MPKELKELINWLRAEKHSIFKLQEVHCSEDTADIWFCECQYQGLFGFCSGNKAGVGILFNNNFNFSDPKGIL